jgi:conjugal transfer ATP-binding protein TraC
MRDRTETLAGVFGVVQSYDDDEGLFVIAPGEFGFGVIADPLTGMDESTAEKMNQLLTLPFPAGAMMQFTLFSGPDIEQYLTRFEVVRGGTSDPVLRQMMQERVNFLRQGVDDPIDNVSGVRLHDIRVVITVKLPAGRFDAFDPTKAKPAQELRQSVLQTLKTIGFRYEVLTRERYLRFMQVVLNQGPDASWRHTVATRVSEDQLLCEQILDPDNAISVDSTGLWLGKQTRVKVLSPKQYPQSVGINTALRYIGDFLQGQRGIREPVLITMNLIFEDVANERNKREVQQAWATRNAEGPLARFVSKYGKTKKSLDIAMRALDNGDRLVKAYIGIALFCRNEEDSVRAVANAKSYWREFRWQMLEDRYFVLPLFCQLLPFAGDTDIQPILGRYKTFPSSSVVALVPVLGPWRGTSTPLVTPFSRDGQVMAVSPFDSETNYNFCVSAESGAGKSFFVNELVCSMRATGGAVRIIDVGNSYRNLCEILDGQYIEFDPDREICLNPFDSITRIDEEMAELTVLLEIMAAPKDGLTDYSRAALEGIVRQEYAANGPASTIDGVRDRCLASEDPRVRDLAVQLGAFCTGGQYGRYFNGRSTLDMSNPFIVLELEHLKQQKHLQRIVLLMLMLKISQQMFRGSIGQQKMLVIDEAWDLLGSDETRDFIVAFYRRVRKANGAVGTITQSISDFYRNTGAQAIIENSANQYLLKQAGESLNMIQQEKRLDLGEFGYKLLRSVHTIKGEYSEIMFRTNYGTGIGRLVVAPYTQLAYSTHPDDRAAIKAYRDRNVPLHEAILRVLDDRSKRFRSAA